MVRDKVVGCDGSPTLADRSLRNILAQGLRTAVSSLPNCPRPSEPGTFFGQNKNKRLLFRP